MTRRAWIGALALLAALLPAGGCRTLTVVERVVFITVDTTRADRLGCYGYELAATPHLDRLAAESTLFEQAVSPVPTTLPSHSTMFTGLYPHDHGVRYNLFYRLDSKADTLAESLKKAGYATAAFPATQIVAAKFGLNQGFDTYVDPPEKPDPNNDHPMAGVERSAKEGVDLTLEWLAKQGDAKSFVWLHLYDAHWPYVPPFPYSAEYRDRPYDGEIAYMDAQLGRLFDRLRQDPQWAKTLVIVVGDHGEGLYDHGERWHALLTYESTQRVPLIIRAPGGRTGRVTEAVTIADMTPTVLDLLALPPPGEMRGASLRPALMGQRLPAREVYFESLTGSLIYGWQELRGIRAGGWKLIDAATNPELFNLTTDPGELNNLAAVEATRLEELRGALREMGEPLGGEAMSGAETAQLDPETEALLASLGYVGGGSSGAIPEGARHPRELVDLEPELISAQRAVAQRNWTYVEDLCRYTLGRDPTNKWALTQIVGAMIGTGRMDEGHHFAETLIRLYPDTEQGYQASAEVFMAQGRPKEAHAVLTAGLAQKPSSEMLTFLAIAAAFEAGTPPVCEGEVDAAVRAHPGSSRLLLARARCEARKGENGAALATLEIAVRRGFKRAKELEHEPDFAEVVKLPGFAELVKKQS